MRDIVTKLLDAAVTCDHLGFHRQAKIITGVIEEIENARHIRGTPDKGNEPERDAKQNTSGGTGL